MAGKSREKPASMKRLRELATPKQPESIWITTVGRRFNWGDQESMWPLSPSALTANPTPRLIELSKPKADFMKDKQNPQYLYSCGRSSVIWDVPPPARAATASERLEQLSQPKGVPSNFIEDRPHYVFSCGRSSPLWQTPVAPEGGLYGSTERIDQLARPKPLHPDYLPRRECHTIIPRNALRAKASDRLDTLATPRIFPDGPYRSPEWQVNAETKVAYCSKRLAELAIPKGLTDGYQPDRGSASNVSRSARYAVASDRVHELAKPITRDTMDHVQFDPEAFVVKQNALKARCTRRLEMLAQPLVR